MNKMFEILKIAINITPDDWVWSMLLESKILQYKK
jgi:hypothetical protein